MMPIEGPATLPRSLDQLLALARRARCTLCVPLHIDGDRLFAYWENTLDSDARHEVEEQAHSSEECRRWLEEIGKMF